MCSEKGDPANKLDIDNEFDDESTVLNNHSENIPALLQSSPPSNSSVSLNGSSIHDPCPAAREMLESMGIAGMSARTHVADAQRSSRLSFGTDPDLNKSEIMSVYSLSQDASASALHPHSGIVESDDTLPVHVSSQRRAAKDILRADSDDADIVENIEHAGRAQVESTIPGPRDQLSFASASALQRHIQSSHNAMIRVSESRQVNGSEARTTATSITRAIDDVKNGIIRMENALPKECPQFDRINIAGETVHDVERSEVSRKFIGCLRLRKEFVWMPKKTDNSTYNIRETPQYVAPGYVEGAPLPPRSPHRFMFVNGNAQVFSLATTDAHGNTTTPSAEELSTIPVEYLGLAKDGVAKDDVPTIPALYAAPLWTDFCDALSYVVSVGTNGPCKSWAHTRLTILETQKRMHSLMNHDVELSQSKAVPHRDFYNVRKIDNHVHHSACMNQKHLLRYIKKKIKEDGAKTLPVIQRGDATLTLQDVFDSLGLTAYDLSIDTMDMHAGQTFHRFDKFNLKYNPLGESSLREIFLKYNNYIRGKYLAEITQEVFDDLETNKYQFAEYRISIYGRQEDEWDKLADWIIDNDLFSHNVRWMIQIPRLYSVYRKIGQISCLQDMLSNIFRPLFEVSIDPSSHPKLHVLLESIVGFDCVDDESIRTRFFDARDPPPQEWTSKDDPHYCSFLYYLYANLYSLNELRESRGMKTFALRPHAGEAGDMEHIASSFLIAHSINHGLTLFKSPPLQYLYYLCQSGISLSPLSNNLLFLEYQKNPFPKYFARGLNVALSTDDPLMIHVTKEPLVEEFSVASQVWKLSSIDMCEIARNSVLQSGFEHRFKAHWLGNNYWNRDVNGNDIRCTNVPDIRIQFRNELLHREHSILASLANEPLNMGLIDPLF